MKNIEVKNSTVKTLSVLLTGFLFVLFVSIHCAGVQIIAVPEKPVTVKMKDYEIKSLKVKMSYPASWALTENLEVQRAVKGAEMLEGKVDKIKIKLDPNYPEVASFQLKKDKSGQSANMYVFCLNHNAEERIADVFAYQAYMDPNQRRSALRKEIISYAESTEVPSRSAKPWQRIGTEDSGVDFAYYMGESKTMIKMPDGKTMDYRNKDLYYLAYKPAADPAGCNYGIMMTEFISLDKAPVFSLEDDFFATIQSLK